MSSDILLADNETEAQHQQDGHAVAGHADADHTTGNTSHHEEEGSVPPAKVFDHLLGELGDHHSLTFFNYKVAELPIILFDQGSLHVYANPHSMEEAGLYTMHHHKPVRNNETHDKPSLDLSVTNFVVFQWIGMLILFVAFISVKNKYKKNPQKAPKGLQNAVEVFVVYIRDNIVRPNVGSDKVTRKLLPYFLSLFFFILVLNVLGLIPGGHSATGAIGVTAGLAITAFLVINITSIKEAGIGAWFHHLLGGAPWWLGPIMIPIEIIGLFAKPFALAVRLFANMTAGHIVLVALIGLIFFFQTPFVAAVSTPFSIFIYALETLVVFLQAYIFTMLTAVFVGLSLGDHAHDHDHEEVHPVMFEHV